MQDFKEIYDQYNTQVRSTIFFYTRDKDSVDDSVQECFIKIWKNLHKFDGRSSLKTWIYRIAINTAIDTARKNKKHAYSAEIEDKEDDTDFEKQTIEKELITKGFGSLNEKHKTVLVLYAYEGQKIKEISEILKISEGTVKSRLFSAKKNFSNFLKDHGVNYE